VADRLSEGRPFRLLTLVDNFSRVSPAIEIDFPLNGKPGKQTDNAFIESFNGRLRQECLNQNWFTSLADARQIIEAWREDYNELRPHSSLDHRTPSEYVIRWQQIRAAQEAGILTHETVQ